MESRKPQVLEEKSPANPSRRSFIARLGQVGALTALGSPLFTSEAFAQSAPAAAPADPLGTVPNSVVMGEKDAVMKIHSERPLTASASAEFLNDSVTPNKRLFIRNNLLTPEIDAAAHKLKVTGLVEKPLEFTMDELKKLPNVTIQAMLECAGSGRTAYQPTPRGTSWPPTGGMGCPQWTGVRLRDILEAAKVKPGAVHVAFVGADFSAVATAAPVVRSIPMSKAMEANTLLAWAVNGEPLPKVHGFPLRALVPGWAGSASGKWLKEVQVLDAPFKGTYMDDSYRIPPHAIAPGEKMPSGAVSAEAWPVKSIITSPTNGAKFKVGSKVVFEGKAWAGDNAVRKVEISLDEGVTWQRADLTRQGDKYAWRQFSFEFTPEKPDYVTCLARATDNQGNVQPIIAAWNPLGYYWNGIHRVGVTIERA